MKLLSQDEMAVRATIRSPLYGLEELDGYQYTIGNQEPKKSVEDFGHHFTVESSDRGQTDRP